MRAALDENIQKGRPVIPVLLPGCGDDPSLPLFLRGYTWVDFRSGLQDANARRDLIWGITGTRAASDLVGTDEVDFAQVSEPVDVFLFNEKSDAFAELLDSAIAPVLREHHLSYQTLSDVVTDDGSTLAQTLEEKAADSKLLLFNLSRTSPWIPLPLESPKGPGVEVVILLERGVELPSNLSYT